jgi:hypothetical protein
MGWKRTPLDVGKLISFVALAALIIGAALWWTLRFASVAVNRSDIVSLDIEPYPEGSPFPAFQRIPSEPGARPLTLVEDFIPIPLPAPTRYQGSCRSGGHLVIKLANGRTISYGPCTRPSSIDHLWAHMVDIRSNGTCRPRCGPGGEVIPLHRV